MDNKADIIDNVVVHPTPVNNLHAIEEEVSLDEVRSAFKKIGLSPTDFFKNVLKKIAEGDRKRDLNRWLDEELVGRRKT